VVDILFFGGIPHPDADSGFMGGDDDRGPLFGFPQFGIRFPRKKVVAPMGNRPFQGCGLGERGKPSARSGRKAGPGLALTPPPPASPGGL
jgi:hypothetical protein